MNSKLFRSKPCCCFIAIISTQHFEIYRLTRHKEVSYFVISFCERIEDPSTASVELCVGQIVVILQASEAVGPQTNLLNLGAIEPRVSLDPGGRHKGGDDEDHTDNSDRKSCVTRQCSLPLHIGVREQVVRDPHLRTVEEKRPAAHISTIVLAAKMAEDRCDLY